MYVPLIGEEVAVENSDAAWRVERVDEIKETVDLRMVGEPSRRWRAVPFAAVSALYERRAEESYAGFTAGRGGRGRVYRLAQGA